MWVNVVRYGLPALIFLAGVVVSGTQGRVGIAAGAMFVSAATAVLLTSFLLRMSIEGERDRDREEAARRYFDEHGHWPDQAPERHA
jgi:uncharacterized membrane protein YoaK (UPF0700 family)